MLQTNKVTPFLETKKEKQKLDDGTVNLYV